MGRKIDQTQLEREYITSDLSIRELARRHEVAWSTIAQYSRNNDWPSKRSAYKQAVMKQAVDKVADRHASEEVEIRTESVIAARATIRAYLEALRNGSIVPNPKDALEAAKFLQLVMGEPTSRTEARVLELSAGIDVTDLSGLVELARARLIEGTVADDSEPGSPGTFQN